MKGTALKNKFFLCKNHLAEQSHAYQEFSMKGFFKSTATLPSRTRRDFNTGTLPTSCELEIHHIYRFAHPYASVYIYFMLCSDVIRITPAPTSLRDEGEITFDYAVRNYDVESRIVGDAKPTVMRKD